MGDVSEPQGQPVVRHEKEKKLYTFDDVIRERAEDSEQVPLIAYPKTKDGIDDYEFFTGKKLNRLVDGAAKALIQMGIEPVYEDTVAAIYGPSTFSYIITVFALGRLGYTTFILSPRLPVSACVSLLSGARASLLLYAPQYLQLATKTAQEFPLNLFPILTREQYDTPGSSLTPEFKREKINGEAENKRILILMHSSGSTGTPKPIHYRHARLFATFRTAQKLTAFQSVPLFHAHGFISFIQAIFVRKCIFLFNGLVPQTNGTVTKAIKSAVLNGELVEVVWTVPYVLKLLCEGGKDGEGVKVLKGCKVVSCSGSRTPDELGDLLVGEGIPFGTVFGATEVALILHSLNRPPGDNAWNYLRPPPHIAPFILMRPLPSQSPSLPPHEIVHECIVLDGHVGKMTSNSNDPPNSYHTSDLFIPHPSIKNAWKPIGRLDDRITLLNGEKVLPLAIEGRITQHPFVREAVVFGVDRSVPGLLLFRSMNARGLSDEEFLDQVWPVIEDANSKAEGFSQISSEMVVVLGEDVECPVTDKSSIKRAAVYRDFKDVIDQVYVSLESSQEGSLIFDLPGLGDWIVEKFTEMGIELESKETDFFSAGVDSLKAIQMRVLVIKSLDLGGNAAKCPSMIVYDSKNPAGLAKALIGLRAGEVSTGVNEIKQMEELVERFSLFEKREVVDVKEPQSSVVLLTGSTGSLGSHILNQLVASVHVSKIICPIRASSPETPFQRLEAALSSRGFPSLRSSEKIITTSADILDLPAQLSNQITHIIHCAWSVNFALPVSSFVFQLETLRNLVNLSLATPFAKPAKLLFCSSVGTAMSTPGSNISIEEAPIPSLANASPTGYARSKLVGERMLETAVEKYGADATILRIGQIVPSTVKGEGSMLWNPNEMIPLTVRSALTTGTLPDQPGNEDTCSWIDQGTLSRGIVELAGLTASPGNRQLVYNLVSPRPFSWKRDFLPSLREAGLKFEVVVREEWLKRLRGSSVDAEKNPSRKLLGFWEAQVGGSDEDRKMIFVTKEAERRSETLRNMGKVIEGDYVARLLSAWKEVW